MTGTIVAPMEAGELPDVAAIRGLRLDQLLFVTTGLLVGVIVGLLAAVAWVSTKSQFEETSGRFTEQVQAQATEFGQTLSHTLSLTSATSLRDNNYAFLSEVARSIIADNPNILRVQIYDADSQLAADSAPDAKLGTSTERKPERRWNSALYEGKPIIEYQEPIDYGSQSGKGVVVISYSLESLQKQLHALESVQAGVARRNATTMAGLGLGSWAGGRRVGGHPEPPDYAPLGVLTDKVMQLAAGDLGARAEEVAGRRARGEDARGGVQPHGRAHQRPARGRAHQGAARARGVARAHRAGDAAARPRGLQVGPLRIAGLVVTADACGGDWWLRAALDEQPRGHRHRRRHRPRPVHRARGHQRHQRFRRGDHHAPAAGAQRRAAHLLAQLNHGPRGQRRVPDVQRAGPHRRAPGRSTTRAGGHPSPIVFNRPRARLASLPARGALLGATPTPSTPRTSPAPAR